MAKKFLSILRAITVLSTLFCAGCAMWIADMAVSGAPTFQDVSKACPEIKDGHGRIFIYFPRQGLKTFSPIGVGGFVIAYTTIDEDLKIRLMDRTFVFADLEEGKHIITCNGNYKWSEDHVLEVDVVSGSVLYIELNKNSMENTPPRIVDETEALEALEQLRYAYEQPLPLNDQPDWRRTAM